MFRQPEINLTKSLEGKWLNAEPIRVGPVSASLPTPDLYITTELDGYGPLRADLYAHPDDYQHNQEIIFWSQMLVIGFGHRCYVLNPEEAAATEIDLGGYFCQLWPLPNALLISSQNTLLCLASDGETAWTSQRLAVDGVVISKVQDGLVHCQGQTNPPDGWSDYTIDLASGKILQQSG